MKHSTPVAVRRRPISRQVSFGRLMPLLLSAVALVTAVPAAWAANATTTTLFVTPESPSSGAVMTMTAQVSSTENTVAGGTVTFVDTYNGVSEPLGTVQVQSTNGNAGTAVLETAVGGVGTHQFVATYNGTATLATSASTPQGVNFVGPYLSASALAYTGSAPNYTFNATVSAFGPITPTGNVTFTDTTSNVTLGSAALNSSTLVSGFTPVQNYAIAGMNNNNTGGTNGPAIGDFNGDGRPDYAVPTNAGPIVIELGSANGTFTTGTPINTTGFTPVSVVVDDFNGDGKQDLAVLGASGTGSVNIYLGVGDGTFGAAKNYPVATATSASRILAVGDFNRDGIPDLVASNSGLGQVAVLLGNGDGSFQAPVPYAVGSGPWNIVVGDINKDGFLDLAVASDGSGNATILLGNGDGTFQSAIYVPTGASQVGSVAIGDFNGDGYPDLATTSAPDNSVYVLLNNGATPLSFQTAVPYSLPNAGPYYLTIADFNRDGFLDILSANNGNNTVGVLLGTGTGTFGAATSYSVGGGAIFANAADINGDDRVDLTAVTDNGLSVLLSGQSEMASISNIAINGCNTQSVTATYAGDGNYGLSTSAPITLAPSKQTTGLTLTISPLVVNQGQQTTLTATLSPYSYGTTTTNGETVTFSNLGVPFGTATLTNGVAVLVITPPATGTYSVQASYGGDCAFLASNSNTLTGSVLLNPGLSWATPAAISYGTPLGSTQLDATAITPGTFTYSPASPTVLTAGTHTLSVTFTPNSSSYGSASTTVQIVVKQDPTVITWPIPTPISYGTPLSGFQLDASASGGVVSVPLTNYFNVFGIYTPGTKYSNPATGGFDADGYSYSTTTLGSTVVWNGMTFNIGPANAKDAVDNQTITLPTGKYTNLYMLGAMVNNIQPSGVYYTVPFTVTYTDGTTTVLNQTLSDWVYAAGWPGESVINCSEDRNFQDGTTQADSVCVYGYQIVLDPTKTVSTIQLPATRNIVMLAMDLTTPTIPGTFVYTPPAGTIEPVGTDTLSVVFTPTDTTDYTSSSGTVKLVVGNPVTPIVTPTISWPTPANITYGTALGATQLDAVAMGAPRPTPVTPTSQLSVLAMSNDNTSYLLAGFDGTSGLTYSYKALNNGSVNYAGATFTLGQPTVPDAITSGAVYTLPTPGNYSTVYLIGAATTTLQTSVPFILTYSDGTTSTQTLAGMSSWASSAGYAGESIVATTTYANKQNGSQVSGTYDLYGYQLTSDPTKNLVSVTLPNIRNIVILALGFGTNTQVVVPGTYAYSYTIPPNPPVTPASGAILPVGTWPLSVAFTPTNTAAYASANGSTTITVGQATPVITWPTPAAITVGTALSNIQLNATASSGGSPVLGTFQYTPGSGTVLGAGTHTLSVLFTPTDTTDYTTATATVQLVVGTTGSSGVSGAPVYSSGDCCFFSQPTPYAITVSGSTAAPTGTVNVVFNGQTIGTGTLTPGTGTTSSATLLLTSSYFVPGNNTVTLNYLGDANYVANNNTAVIPLRNPAIVANPAAVTGGLSTIEVPYTYVVAGSMTFTFTPNGGVASDLTNETATNCSSGTAEPAGFVCTFEIAFNPALPGMRRGVVEVDFTSSTNQAEPKLYLFLSGLGSAPQMALSNATQATLNTTLNQPQSLTFKPTDTANANLYVANSGAKRIDTLSSTGGGLTHWNKNNTANLVYPSDVSFDSFGDLLVSDATAAKVFSFSASAAETESTVNTGSFTLGMPTAARIDFGGNIYIADGGNTPQIIEIPGETFASYTPSVLNTGSQSVSFPQALAIDNTGANLYIGDGNLNEILEVALNGSGTTVFSLAPCDSTTVTTCALNSPAGFAFDPNGDMFITDSDQRVLWVPSNHSSGGLTEQLPLTGLLNPTGITLDGSGNVYVTDLNGTVVKLLQTTGSLPKFTTIGSTQVTTVLNTGNLPLTTTGATFSNAGTFTESDNCQNIPGGGTCVITIKYAANTGPASQTVTINSNAFAPGGVTIALSH
jgi:Bacterial Ig-like domain (group 3)/FG-GAP-like repeat